MDDLRNLDQDDVKGLTVYLGGIEQQVSRWIQKEFQKEIKKEIKREIQSEERNYQYEDQE